MTPTLNELEREARATRALIADLQSLTQKFDQALVRAETERNLHFDKIAAEQAHLADLKDMAALIVQHLGADVPAVAEVDEVWESEAREVETVEPELEALIAVADSPVEDSPVEPEPFIPEAEPEPTFEYVAAAVQEIASSPPVAEDQSDAPEMTDHEVERLQDQRLEQTLAALEQDARQLETVGDAPRARPFMSFGKANPFA